MLTKKDKHIAYNVAMDCAVNFYFTVNSEEIKINEATKIFYDHINKYEYTQDRIDIQAAIKRAIKYFELQKIKVNINDVLDIADKFFASINSIK